MDVCVIANSNTSWNAKQTNNFRPDWGIIYNVYIHTPIQNMFHRKIPFVISPEKMKINKFCIYA